MSDPRDFVISLPLRLPEGYYVRRCFPCDEEEVLSLLNLNWPPPHSFNHSFFSAMHFVFVALHRDRVIGTASAGLREGKPSIHWVAVEESQKHKGVGAALVAHVLAYWQERAVPQVFVRTNPTTPENVAFYHALGFRDYECPQV